MAVDLYFDHNVPRAVADGLRRRGVDVLTALADGFERATDLEILDRATELGRVAVSSDHDFIVEGRRRQKEGARFAGIIFVRQDLPVGVVIDDLELIALAGEPGDLVDSLLFLPIR